MAAGPGKVSFSFSKFNIKKPSLNVQPKETVKKVDKIEFIDSIEDNSLNVINGDDCEVKKPLVIPLQHPNLLLQSMINAVNSRKEKVIGEEVTQPSDEANGVEAKLETLEEMAARELIQDATQQLNEKPVSDTLTVPMAKETNTNVESSLDDYENIPIADFGAAMLRGMGWDPKKGIGKNGRVVKVTGPTVRPKGLGLGADKAVASQKPTGKNVSEKEVLTKGSKVRITVGQYKNMYGTVEGFHDDAGRIDVHMALSNDRLSINECFAQLVTPQEFAKYSKVININAFNNYKEREESRTSDVDISESRRREVSPKKDSKENRRSSHPSSSRREVSPDFVTKRNSKENKQGYHSSSSRRKVSPDPVPRKPWKESKYDSHSSKSRKSKKYDSDSDEDVKNYRGKQSSRSRRRDSSSESDDYSERRSGRERDNSSRSDAHSRHRSRSDKHSK